MDTLAARFWEWVAAEENVETWEYCYVSHLLSKGFREHLPPGMRGDGSEKKVFQWLATLPDVVTLRVEDDKKRAFRVVREVASQDPSATTPSADTRVPDMEPARMPVMEPARMDRQEYYDILSGAWVLPELAVEMIFSTGVKPNPAPPSIPPPYFQSSDFAQRLVARLKDCRNFLEAEAADIADPVNLLGKDPHSTSCFVASRPCRGGQVHLTRAEFLREVRTACEAGLCWPTLPESAQEAHRSPREKSVAFAEPQTDLDACQVPSAADSDLDVTRHEEQPEAIQKANTVNAVCRRNMREAVPMAEEERLREPGKASEGDVVIGQTHYTVPKIVNIAKGMTVFAEWDGCLYSARVLDVVKSRFGKSGTWKVLVHFIGRKTLDDRWVQLASLRIPVQFVGRSLGALPLYEREVSDQVLKDSKDSNVEDSGCAAQEKDDDADELDTSNVDENPTSPKKTLKVTARSSPGGSTAASSRARWTSASSSSGATDQRPSEVKAKKPPSRSRDAHAASSDHVGSYPSRPPQSWTADSQTPESRAKVAPWRRDG